MIHYDFPIIYLDHSSIHSSSQGPVHFLLFGIPRTRSIIIRILFCLIIFTLIQPPQKPLLDKLKDRHVRQILRPHARLLKPRRNGTHPDLKLLRHLIHMVVKRILRPGLRIQIAWRQRTRDVRRTQGTQEAAILGPEPVELRANGQRRVAHDGVGLRVQREAVFGRVDVLGAGVAGGRPFLEELARAQRAEAGVCPQLAREGEFRGQLDGAEALVAADVVVALVDGAGAEVGAV